MISKKNPWMILDVRNNIMYLFIMKHTWVHGNFAYKLIVIENAMIDAVFSKTGKLIINDLFNEI